MMSTGQPVQRKASNSDAAKMVVATAEKVAQKRNEAREKALQSELKKQKKKADEVWRTVTVDVMVFLEAILNEPSRVHPGGLFAQTRALLQRVVTDAAQFQLDSTEGTSYRSRGQK